MSLNQRNILITLNESTPNQTRCGRLFDGDREIKAKAARAENKARLAMKKNDGEGVAYQYVTSMHAEYKINDDIEGRAFLFFTMISLIAIYHLVDAIRENIDINDNHRPCIPTESSPGDRVFSGLVVSLTMMLALNFIDAILESSNAKRFKEIGEGCKNWLKKKFGEPTFKQVFGDSDFRQIGRTDFSLFRQPVAPAAEGDSFRAVPSRLP